MLPRILSTAKPNSQHTKSFANASQNKVTFFQKNFFCTTKSPIVASLKGRNILSTKDFTEEEVDELFEVSEFYENLLNEKKTVKDLEGKLLTPLFFEPSTRTSCSFQSAISKLGGSSVQISPQNSSFAKGESMVDTLKVLSNFTDIIVLRHSQATSPLLSQNVNVPIINAGDGPNEHPTQALSDLYCMKKELGKLRGLTVTLLGDLRYGRTVHSMTRLFCNFGIKVNLIAPPSLEMPREFVMELEHSGALLHQGHRVEQVLSSSDVLYVTRVQKERFQNQEEYHKMKGSYCVDAKLLQKAPEHMLVMHPLPRIDEISTEVDSDKRATYFKETRYGLIIKMALLNSILSDK